MPRHVLILDDDKHFGPRMATQFRKLGVEAHCPALTVKAIAEAVRSTRIVGIFADAFIGKGRTIGSLLTKVHAAYPTLGLDKIPIWVITGAGEDEDPVGMVRQDAQDMAIQDRWFGKPVRADHLIQALPPSDESDDTPQVNYDWLPLPVRVLDKDGTVIHVNRHWKGAANRPDPHDFIPMDKAPAQKEFWGSIGDDDHAPAAMKRLSAFRLHSDVHDGYLVQVGQRVSGVPETDFNTLCDHIAATLNDVGFTRCRIYRFIEVPGCSGLGRLVFHNHILPIPATDGRKKQYPVPERLAPMLAPRESLPEHGLDYQIRTKAEEAKTNDPSLTYWRDHARGDEVESWVEIPVYVAEFADHGKMVYRTQALLTIDRLGQRESVDGKLEEVERKNIDKITVTLRRMLRDLATSIRNERNQAESEWRKAVDELAPDIQGGQFVAAITERMMAAAMNLSKATSGLIAYTAGPDLNILYNSGARPHLRGKQVPAACNAFPVVECWNTQNPLYIPDWRNSPNFGLVQAIPEQDLVTFDPENGHKLKAYFASIGSLVALPIMAGDKIRGAISLKHCDPWFFTKDKIAALDELIDHTRWSLAAAEEREFRHSWEMTVAHEIKSDAEAISEALGELNNGCASCAGSEYRKDLERRSLHLSDLAIALMTVLGRVAPDTKSVISDPRSVLKQALDYAEDSTRSRQQAFVWRTTEDAVDWRSPLSGQPEMLARVLRVLLENASRHGRSHGEIGLSCTTNGGDWILSIDNPGDLLATIPETPTLVTDGTKMRIDMHVGLAASRTWVGHLGGRINLRQSTTHPDMVEAILHWPLAHNEEGRP